MPNDRLTDDETGAIVEYPYISARSIRVELSATRYAWMGADEVHIFQNADSFAEWVRKEMEDLVDSYNEPEISY